MRKGSSLIAIAVLSCCLLVCGLALMAQDAPPPSPPPAGVQQPPPAKTPPPQVPPQTGQPQKPVLQVPGTPAPPQGDPPKAVFPEKEWDAGKVVRGESIKHDYVVENQGKGVLEIQRVQPACGCTVTEYDKQIQPGKSGKITATVQTTGFSGPIHKTISVSTNDPQAANVQLAVKADVRPILVVEPSENQQFGLVFKGQTMEKEFTIKADDGTPFQINSIQGEDAALQYEIKGAADKKSATFKVILPGDHPVGPVTGRFTLATTHPKVPTININVFGTVREPLTVYPTEITFSGLNKAWVDEHPDDVSLNKTVTLSFDQGGELQVTSVTSNMPNLKTEVQTLDANKRYTVKIHLAPPLKVGDFTGEVKIVTNMKTLTIPVRGKIF